MVTRAAAQSSTAIALAAVTALVTYRTRINPLWIFAAAALLGLGGWIYGSEVLGTLLHPQVGYTHR